MRPTYHLRTLPKPGLSLRRHQFKPETTRFSTLRSSLQTLMSKLRTLLSTRTTYYILTLIAFLTFIYIFIQSTRITRIICSTQYGPCPADLAAGLNSYHGKNILVSFPTLSSAIKSRFPFVISTQLHIKNHNTLNLEVIIDKPLAAITTPRLLQIPTYFLVNEAGNIINQTGQTSLPLLVASNLQTPLGDLLPPEQIQAIILISQLHQLGHLFSAEQVTQDTLQVILQPSLANPTPKSIQVLFPLDNGQTPNRLVSALQLILTQATIDSDRAQIDLRLTQPVIQDLTITIIPTPVSTESATPSSNLN